MKDFIHRNFEAWLIIIAKNILRERNVQRSLVVSRKDNNKMWYMSEELEAIAKRMKSGYKEEKT
jgi:hypothetical protein